MKFNLLATRILCVGLFLFLCARNALALGIGDPPPTPPPPPKPLTVTVTYPTNGTVVTDQVITVTGTVDPGGSTGLAAILSWVDNSLGRNYQSVSPQSPWSFQASLVEGFNTVGVDVYTEGNGGEGSVRVYYRQLLPLYLTINGLGTVTPDLTGNLLEMNHYYEMTAQPSPGYVFAGWTGTSPTDSRTLSFTMASNTVLQANFVPTPFTQAAGNYYGVVIPIVTSEKLSGFLNLTLTEDGAFTASIRVGNEVSSFSGFFLANGSVSTLINPKRGLLDVELQLDIANHTLKGLLKDPFLNPAYSPAAELLATRQVYNSKTNPAPQAGKYTLLISGGDDSSVEPGGDGYATVSVDGSGNVNVAGKLSDGTPFTEKTFVTDSGQCPIVASLYSGNGFISGWLAFTNAENSDIVGTLDWKKPAGVKKSLYPSGFEIQSAVVGSSYDSGNLNFTSGFLMLTNGGLSEPITITGNPTIIPQGKSNGKKGAGASLKVTKSTGVFTGTVTGIPVSGVILPKANFGGGFFLGTNESGRVYLGP